MEAFRISEVPLAEADDEAAHEDAAPSCKVQHWFGHQPHQSQTHVEIC